MIALCIVQKIEVTPGESTNYYHHHDNRVMPQHVDARMADVKDYWSDPGALCGQSSFQACWLGCRGAGMLVPPTAETLAPAGVLGDQRMLEQQDPMLL